MAAPSTVSARGTVPVAQPQPEHDRDGRGVLEEQRDADLHVGDGVEVAELGTGHGRDAVDGDQPGVVAQQVPATAQRQDARDDQHGRGDARCARPPRRRRSSRCRAGRGPARRTGRSDAADANASTRPVAVRDDRGVMCQSRHGHDVMARSCNVSTCFSRMTRTRRCRQRSPWSNSTDEPGDPLGIGRRPVRLPRLVVLHRTARRDRPTSSSPYAGSVPP